MMMMMIVGKAFVDNYFITQNNMHTCDVFFFLFSIFKLSLYCFLMDLSLNEETT